MVSGILEVSMLLIAAHCLCDYPLQGDFMASGKNKNTSIGKEIWMMVLPAHAAIHAGAVLIITGSAAAFILEFISHAVIDYLKCEGKLSFAQDQLAHLMVKVSIVAMLFGGFL